MKTHKKRSDLGVKYQCLACVLPVCMYVCMYVCMDGWMDLVTSRYSSGQCRTREDGTERQGKFGRDQTPNTKGYRLLRRGQTSYETVY